MLTETQKKVLKSLVDTFNTNGIEFQISGGIAAISYGARRMPHDIDVEIYKKDVEAARELFKGYITEDWNNILEGPEDPFDLWIMKLAIEGVPIDISQVEGMRVLSPEGEWVPQPEVLEIEMRTVEGIELPVQAKESLIAYKKLLKGSNHAEDIEQMTHGTI